NQEAILRGDSAALTRTDSVPGGSMRRMIRSLEDWKGWCQEHPGSDIQCRCTALAYWDELIDEVDGQIDLLSEDVENIPDTVYEGLTVRPERGAEAKETLKAENAARAKAAADREFPGEKWIEVEDGIYRSAQKDTGTQGYIDELRIANILHDIGGTVYLVPERRTKDKKYDAIVNGLQMEFKTVRGGRTALKNRFFESRLQAPNVFINLENSNLTRPQIMSALYGARNSTKYPTKETNKDAHTGGRIILKIKGRDNLIYLNVDDLRPPKQ
ncbi:MAG: hypothetical protein FWD94_07105, partial [Treponema sp.]|nr:hypothetical protein [Treponema sp.]